MNSCATCRCVLAWRLSNKMDASFCLDALDDAVRKGRPEIFDTDQGAQFISTALTDKLEAAGGEDQHGLPAALVRRRHRLDHMSA